MIEITEDVCHGGYELCIENGRYFRLSDEQSWDLFEALNRILIDKRTYVLVTPEGLTVA